MPMSATAFKQPSSANPAGAGNVRQTVLLIDDDRAIRSVLTIQLEHMGYQVIEAANGVEALKMLDTYASQIDVILLDREMPVMNGMQFITEIRTQNKYTSLPIVMVTGSGQPSHVTEGIQAGVFYYLVKPIHYNVLSTIVSSAMRETQRIQKMQTILQKHHSGFSMMTKGDFTISTLNEAEYLSALLANCFTKSEQVFSGLVALITNGIEHGNLEIGFDTKNTLITENRLADEIQRRMTLPENCLKTVHVTYEKMANMQIIKIRDMGKGFDWQRYIQKDPSTITGNNGRGISMAVIRSFDQLSYNHNGNEVTAIVHTY
jgi:two-component system, cell cycle response regulator